MAQQDMDNLASRVKSLELQLKVLKAQLANETNKTEALANLYGVLRGQSNSTEADIAQATYRLSDKLS